MTGSPPERKEHKSFAPGIPVGRNPMFSSGPFETSTDAAAMAASRGIHPRALQTLARIRLSDGEWLETQFDGDDDAVYGNAGQDQSRYAIHDLDSRATDEPIDLFGKDKNAKDDDQDKSQTGSRKGLLRDRSQVVVCQQHHRQHGTRASDGGDCKWKDCPLSHRGFRRHRSRFRRYLA